MPASSYGVPIGSRLAGGKIDLVIPNSVPSSPAYSFQAPVFGASDFGGSFSSVNFNPYVSSTASPLLDVGQVQFGTSTVAPVIGGVSSFETSTLAPSVVASTPGTSSLRFGSEFGAISSGFPASSLEFGAVTPASVDASSLVSGSSFGAQFDSAAVKSSSLGSQFVSGASGVSDVSSASGATTYTGAAASGDVQVQKHLYFFSAPDEKLEVRQRINIPQVSRQKHYKIIFIKAPAYVGQSRVNIPLLPQNEEKTLVYVLVKKPEENGEINVQLPEPTPPSKPEVYFIKYKTQQDAEAAIANLQGGAEGRTVSVGNVGSLFSGTTAGGIGEVSSNLGRSSAVVSGGDVSSSLAGNVNVVGLSGGDVSSSFGRTATLVGGGDVSSSLAGNVNVVGVSGGDVSSSYGRTATVVGGGDVSLGRTVNVVSVGQAPSGGSVGVVNGGGLSSLGGTTTVIGGASGAQNGLASSFYSGDSGVVGAGGVSETASVQGAGGISSSFSGRSFVPSQNFVQSLVGNSVSSGSAVTTSSPSVAIVQSGAEESSEAFNLVGSTENDRAETDASVQLGIFNTGSVTTVKPHDIYGPPNA